MWAGWTRKADLFRWVWGCGGGWLGLGGDRGLGGGGLSFAGHECGCGLRGGVVYIDSGGGGFCRCIVLFVLGYQWPTSWVGDVLDEEGHVRVQFPSEDVS